MKFKIKKQLLNEEILNEARGGTRRKTRSKGTDSPSTALISEGGPRLPMEIKAAVQRILTYKEKPELFSELPIKDAAEVQGFLQLASADEKEDIGEELVEKIEAAIAAVINAKTTAASEKEKEAQQAPLKKALRTLVIFSLNSAGDDINVRELGDDAKFKYNIDNFKKYLKQIKDSLEYVKNHELSSISEVISEDAASVIDRLTDSALATSTLRNNIIKAIEARIASIESGEKNKEFENSPKKKALTILAVFALDASRQLYGRTSTDYYYDNKILQKNLDKVKKALITVGGGDSDLDLTEARLHERKILKESLDSAKALATEENLEKIIEIIKARIQKIESDKASADADEATKKQLEEKRKKEVSELITVCSFFHDKVGFDKYYSSKIIRNKLSKWTKGLVDSERTKIEKKFPNIDMYLDWICKNLVNFTENTIREKYDPAYGTSSPTVDEKTYEEMKKIRGRILTKYEPTFQAIAVMFEDYQAAGVATKIQVIIGKKGDDTSTFLGRDKIVPLQESKKYKLKLIENKRG